MLPAGCRYTSLAFNAQSTAKVISGRPTWTCTRVFVGQLTNSTTNLTSDRHAKHIPFSQTTAENDQHCARQHQHLDCPVLGKYAVRPRCGSLSILSKAYAPYYTPTTLDNSPAGHGTPAKQRGRAACKPSTLPILDPSASNPEETSPRRHRDV